MTTKPSSTGFDIDFRSRVVSSKFELLVLSFGFEIVIDTLMVSFTEFVVMFNDPGQGFGIMSTLLKLETCDRIRHSKQSCSICWYPITGSRFKEMKSQFSLCNQCYSEGKVPPSFKNEEYRFKECAKDSDAMKSVCGLVKAPQKLPLELKR